MAGISRRTARVGQVAQVLVSADTQKCIILHHKNQFLKHFGVLMTKKAPFCTSLRLIRTVFNRLLKKANNHSSIPVLSGVEGILNHLYGLYSFAFSLTSYGISSTKEQVRKNKLFLQNEPKSQKVKFNVTIVVVRNYDQLDTWSRRTKQSQTKPIQSQLKPIKANKMPKQTQFKPKQTQTQKGQNERNILHNKGI